MRATCIDQLTTSSPPCCACRVRGNVGCPGFRKQHQGGLKSISHASRVKRSELADRFSHQHLICLLLKSWQAIHLHCQLHEQQKHLLTQCQTPQSSSLKQSLPACLRASSHCEVHLGAVVQDLSPHVCLCACPCFCLLYLPLLCLCVSVSVCLRVSACVCVCVCVHLTSKTLKHIWLDLYACACDISSLAVVQGRQSQLG